MATAEPVRVATYTLEFSRKGPGLLLRDLHRGKDPQITASLNVIAHAKADILLLVGLDFDLTGATLTAFLEAIEQAGGPAYPHVFAARPNTGMATGVDLDRNGKLGEPRDAQGYGLYPGQGGMALLSRYPIVKAVEFTTMLWRDLPQAQLPVLNGRPFYDTDVTGLLRLSTTAHWDVTVDLPEIGPLSLLAYAATPPVFDGPERRNHWRNADETRFWALYLAGALSTPSPDHPVIVLGKANLDPVDGAGEHAAIQSLLDHPRLQDPRPKGTHAQTEPDHGGDPALDTAAYSPAPQGPGNLRVDFVLPDSRLTVVSAGVDWPASDDARAAEVALASRHRLVWVDIAGQR